MRARLKKKYVFKKKRIKKVNIFLGSLALLFVVLIYSFNFLNKKVLPILLNYAEAEVTKLSTIVINKAVSKHLAEDMSLEDLFIITKGENGYIRTVDFNPIIVNKVLTTTTNTVQINLKYIEQGKLDLIDLPDNVLIDYDEKKLKKGIIYEIPSGIVFNNALISNIGPKIPVKLNLVGDIVSGVKTKITNYGINNALIEVNVNLEVTEQVILPFTSKRVKVSIDIPVAMKLIEGTVPNYYLNGINQNSASITLPVE